MLDHVRVAVAYIVGRMISRSESSHIYDYETGRNIMFSGQVDEDAVSVYDYEKRVYVTGSGTSLYHYGEQCYISLNVSNGSFTGYDYGSGTHFSGNVNGNSINIYDYEKGQHFNYSI